MYTVPQMRLLKISWRLVQNPWEATTPSMHSLGRQLTDVHIHGMRSSSKSHVQRTSHTCEAGAVCKSDSCLIGESPSSAAVPDFGELLYSDLFARAPHLKPLFKDRATQYFKMTQFLTLVANGFDDFGNLLKLVWGVALCVWV